MLWFRTAVMTSSGSVGVKTDNESKLAATAGRRCQKPDGQRALLSLILTWAIFSMVLPSALPGAQKDTKVRVAIPLASPNSTTFVVAREKGYYQEEGLEVELIGMTTGVATQALIGGNVEF